MSGVAAYNVTISSISPFFRYHPNRDGNVSETWNSSYMESWFVDPEEFPLIPYRRTQAASAKLNFEFFGTDLYLCISGLDPESYTVTVDGTPTSASLTSGPDPACGNYTEFSDLLSLSLNTSGNHDVELLLSASPAKEVQFLGGIFTMSVTSQSSQVKELMIDDRDSAWNFVPGYGSTNMWQSSTQDPSDQYLINKTHSWTCVYDYEQSASYSFSGAGGIVLFGIIGDGFQVYSVVLDGITTYLDATSTSRYTSSTPLYMRGGLDPQKNYNITLRNFNIDYPVLHQTSYFPSSRSSVDWCANLDGLLLLSTIDPEPQPTPVEPIPQSPSPSSSPQTHKTSLSAATIAGICVSCALFAVFCGLILMKICRSQRATTRSTASSTSETWRRISPFDLKVPPGFSNTLVQSHADHALLGSRDDLRTPQALGNAPTVDALGPTHTRVSSTSETPSQQLKRQLAPEDLEVVFSYVSRKVEYVIRKMSVQEWVQERDPKALPPKYDP